MKKKILFVCTHNSARSQMAEGLVNGLYGDQYEAYSTGTSPGVVNPFAIEALADLDIDISPHRSKGFDEFQEMSIDIVVTVCDNAKNSCPVFTGAKEYMHNSFADPSAIGGSDDVKLAAFKKSRDEIIKWIHEIFGV